MWVWNLALDRRRNECCDKSGSAAAGAGQQLAIRRGSRCIADYRRERLALLLVDRPCERQDIGLVRDMPFGPPGELAEIGDGARFSHAPQTEFLPIGKDARDQDLLPHFGGERRELPARPPQAGAAAIGSGAMPKPENGKRESLAGDT